MGEGDKNDMTIEFWKIGNTSNINYVNTYNKRDEKQIQRDKKQSQNCLQTLKKCLYIVTGYEVHKANNQLQNNKVPTILTIWHKIVYE